MAAEIPSLVQKLKTGEDLAVVIDKLGNLCAKDDDSRAIMKAGAAKPLIQLLTYGANDLKEKAASTLWELAVIDDNKGPLAKDGAIPPLIQLIVSGNDKAKEMAAGALWNISANTDNKVLCAKEGAIPPLIQLLSSGNATAKEKAALALGNLALNAENKVIIAKEGAIKPLIQLVSSGTDTQKEKAARTLWNLSSNEANKTLIAKEGAINPLIQLAASGPDIAKEKSLGALWNLATNNDNKVLIPMAGGIKVLIACLSSPSDSVKEKALGTMQSLSTNNDNKVLLVEAGVLKLLLAFVAPGTAEKVHEKALSVLGNLAFHDDNCVVFAKEGAIKPLIQVLTSVTTNTAKEAAARTLWNLCTNNDNKALIAKEGAVRPLIQLATFGSDQAKDESSGTLWYLTMLEANRAQIVKEGGIRVFVQLLSCEFGRVCQNAAGALWNLAYGTDNAAQIVKEGGIKLLLQVLTTGSETAIENATGALFTLADINGENQKLIAKDGGIATIISLLTNTKTSTKAKEHVEKLLELLSKSHGSDVAKAFKSHSPAINTNELGSDSLKKFLSSGVSSAPTASIAPPTVTSAPASTPISNEEEADNDEDSPPWYVATPVLPYSKTKKAYEVNDAHPKDIARVVEWYQRGPVDGHDIKSVRVIHNHELARAFSGRVSLLEQRSESQAFAPRWQKSCKNDDERKHRTQINELFQSLAKPHKYARTPHVSLIPMWHGTNPTVMESIFKTGFANLAVTDVGFFGKGLYNTAEAEYAHRCYSKGALLINWVAVFSAMPVTYDDEPHLQAKGNYENYDAHFVPVCSPKHPNTSIYHPCKLGQPHQYTELVVFESSQVLPRFIVELQESLIANPSERIIAPPSSGFASKPVGTWTIDDVCGWLKTLGLTNDYTAIMKENGINGPVLKTMETKDDWKELGVTLFGDVRLLSTATGKLK